jgi:hypothetical protein
MSTYSLNEITTSTDRHKIYILICSEEELADRIAFIQSQKINTIDIGRQLAIYIDNLDDYRYLNIDVFDYTKKLLESYKSKINGVGNDIVAIFNLGILLEPALELNAAQLFKDFSKSTSLIVIWENQFEIPNRLNWSTQKQNIFFDFSDSQLKKLHYAI